MPTVIVRTLRREFRLGLPDEQSAKAFAFIAIEPEIVGPPLEPVDLPIEPAHGLFHLHHPDGRASSGTANHLMGRLHGAIFADVLRSEQSSPIIHGATIIGPWGRAVLIGAKAAGKTTLVLRLAAAGYAVEGDEHLVVGEDSVVVRPRTLRVKESSLDLVPGLADQIRESPFILGWDGFAIHSVSPAVAGRPWRIERGQLHHFVFLEANHGGRSVMRPVRPNEAFGLLMANSLLPSTGVGKAVARLRTLAVSRPAHMLQLGDLEGAIGRLMQLAQH